MKILDVIIEANEPQIYTVGDSHAEGMSYNKGFINYAHGGQPSTSKFNFSGSYNGHPTGVDNVPKGSIIVVAQGANDTANSARDFVDSKGKIKLVPPATIANNVAKVVDAAKTKGQVIFVLFPNGNGRAPGLAKYYSGDYQEEVRDAIRNAVGVPVVDLDGKGLSPDGIHGTVGAYKAAGEEVLSLIKGTQKVDKKPPARENTAPAKGPLAPPGAVANLRFADAGISSLFGGITKGNDGYWHYPTGKVVTDPEIISKAEWDYKEKKTGYKPTTSKTDDGKSKINATSDQSATSRAFHDKLIVIANKLGVNPSDLLRVMHLETAGSMRADKENQIGCVGLIQFCYPAWKMLGVSKAQLKAMTEVEQLDYVYQYYKGVNLPPGSGVADMYMATFLPAALNHPDNFVVGELNGTKSLGRDLTTGMVYRDNPGFKVPGRNYFTVGDVREKIRSMKFY